MTSSLEWWFIRKVVVQFKHASSPFVVATRAEILTTSLVDSSTLDENVWKFCAHYPYSEGGFYWNGNELRYESLKQ